MSTHARDMQRLVEQMEFYFRTAPRDRFLWRRLDESKDGYLDLSLFTISFNRIKAITEDPRVLASALKHSLNFQIHADNSRVRYLGDQIHDRSLDEKTVYVEQFPKAYTWRHLQALFTAACGPVAHVDMPSIPGTERSQGYAFVEFASVESAVLAVSKLNRYMLPLSERPFFEDARELMNAKPLATAVENGAVTTEQLEQVAMNLDLHVISKPTWNRLREEYLAYQHNQHWQALADRRRFENEQLQEGVDPGADPDFTRGCILRFANVHSESNRGVLASLFGGAHDAAVEYIEYERGSSFGFVRYKRAVDAARAMDALTRSPRIHESGGDAMGVLVAEAATTTDVQPLTLDLLTEKEELAYWESIVAARDERRLAQRARQAEEERREKQRQAREEQQERRRLQYAERQHRQQPRQEIHVQEHAVHVPGRRQRIQLEPTVTAMQPAVTMQSMQPTVPTKVIQPTAPMQLMHAAALAPPPMSELKRSLPDPVDGDMTTQSINVAAATTTAPPPLKKQRSTSSVDAE